MSNCNCDVCRVLNCQSEVLKIFEGLYGPYFTPAIDENGNLSWTNNAGLPNPPTLNIMGTPGTGLEISGVVASAGDLPGSAEDWACYLVGTAAPYTIYTYNPDSGWMSLGQLATGPKGDTGPYYSPSVSSSGVITWTNNGGLPNPEGVNIKGPAGNPGQDGVSPTLSVSTITGGHRISITDVNGTTTVDVMDGQDGTDGVSPEVTIATITGGHSVTITDADHPTGQTFNVMDGEDGAESVAWMTYGTSTAADIAAAITAGKLVACKYIDGYGIAYYGILCNVSPSYYFFGYNPSTGAIVKYVCSSASAWSFTSYAIPGPATTETPKPLGTAAVGTSTKYARADHVHKKPSASDVGAVPTSSYNPDSKTSSMTQSVGVDSNGKLWTAPGGGGGGGGASPYSSNPEALGAASPGSSDDYARGDHVHDFPSDFKAALLQMAQKVAYVDASGASYYNDLYDALNHRAASSISATFTQGSATIYDTDSLDTLRQYLVVTASYADSSTAVVTSYTLSGTLTSGTSTITATYEGKTATFSVTVTHTTATYTVTNTLSNCSSSNAAATATEGSSYSATITAASGYTLTGATVSVTMGETDITSSAYNNGTVSIASVTGNLVISVSAVAASVTYSVTNSLSNCSNSNSASTVAENATYLATITAASGYTLTGATVSITMGGNDVTSSVYSSGTISIPNVTGDIVITVTATTAVLSSISAVFNQGQNVVYDTDSLDTLKQYLVVTATYSDSTTVTVPSADYTLSGTLVVGTSTITVAYGGKTTTFTVTVTASPILYSWDFTSSLTDTVGNLTATTNGTQDSSGISFTTSNKYIEFPGVFAKNRTYQIDIGSMSLALASNSRYARLWMVDVDSYTASGGSGYVISTLYKNGDLFYINGAWESNVIVSSSVDSQGAYYSGKTVAFYVDSSGYVKVYVDGSYVGISSTVMPNSDGANVYIGSSQKPNSTENTDNLHTSVFTGFRVYNGLVVT